MKQYRATSPSMNDQWSGNTRLSAFVANGAPPTRSSIQRSSRRVSMRRSSVLAVPEARADRLLVVRDRDDVTVAVDFDRQLRQRAGRGSEHRARPVQHVERALVARTQQLVRRLAVQADRAA